MPNIISGNDIRQSFIDFFVERGHTQVPSASLVPGGDSTLLFTNAGMVQFKDVFLGTDKRPYTRAVNSQKCMRISGKHNDLDQVGRDNTHHTFFEMLGNWSFGDYYKPEAIAWWWELLTKVWGLDKERIWGTYFEDEKGIIAKDDEAAQIWLTLPGFNPDHLKPYGRKDNFWEMAETGPCGPCSEFHYDFGPEACTKKDDPEHECHINSDCGRWTELGNNVFIQYNRISEDILVPLPNKHVDTGMGFERIVSVIQGVQGNYATDLLAPLLDIIQSLSGQTNEQRQANLTPYRVIADHVRAATFLIADGVIPGNVGRNYICRMILRRAARFARKLDLVEPFMANVAEKVIGIYQEAYPELGRNHKTILDNITREEKRFGETLDAGLEVLQKMMDDQQNDASHEINGKAAFDLYASLGLPIEIIRDIARENGFGVDEAGFQMAMDEHRIASGAGKAFGEQNSDDVELYANTLKELIQNGKISEDGVLYDPYSRISLQDELIAIIKDGVSVKETKKGDTVELLFPETCFYVESGGQVADTGEIFERSGESWRVKITDVVKPAAGIIVHKGVVLSGTPKVGDQATLAVDAMRRKSIMRNHTATHLLHAMLHKVVGAHARQAGSLVAPDRLRFDFTNPEPLSKKQLMEIEAGVNQMILDNHKLHKQVKSLQQAMDEGAMALFGEKYGSTVHTIEIGESGSLSYELCGGTHVDESGDIGLFLITLESSIASGIRRIEAVTGGKAYQVAREQMDTLEKAALTLKTSLNEVPLRVESLLDSLADQQKEIARLMEKQALSQFKSILDKPEQFQGVNVISAIIENANTSGLRSLTDLFKQKYSTGVIALGTITDGKPLLIAAVTDDLIKRGLHSGNLIREMAKLVDGGGGGKPDLAQAGGKDPSTLPQAMAQVMAYVKHNLTE